MFKILSKNEIWLFNNRTMNDYSEGRWIENIISKYIETNNLKDNAQFITLVENYFNNSLPFYFSSFSANKDSLSQWKGYSNDATGVCIGFDIDESKIQILPPLPNGNPSLSLGWVKIEYDKTIQENNCFAVLNSWKEISSKSYDGDVLVTHINMLKRMSMFFKNPVFNEESEWRLISTPLIAERNKDLVLLGNCSNIEYLVKNDIIRSYFRYEFKNKIVKEIVIGPKSKLDQFNFENFLMTYGYKETKINSSEITYK